MAVFSSSLTRTNLQVENNLYDIVRNVPQASVAPTSCYNDNSDCTVFQHKTDKFFEPKKKSKLKVRTVRDVRKEYEKYVYTYLKDDLEKQKNLIFKKIESGSAGEDDTVDIAKKILQSDQPKLRSTWFMITKVNPLRHRNSVQYAFWNGIKIRLSGSKGGSDKFKWKYDISQNNKCLKRITKCKQRKKNCLLKSSIFCNFKPGPLSKKCMLDKSYQKWTIGEATLVELPRVTLVIESKYNSAVDLSVLKYIEDLPDENGKLNENWTNFALSALGTSVNGSVKQKKGNSKFSFDLKYKNEQKFLVTRRDVNTYRRNPEIESTTKQTKLQETNDKEVSAVVEELVRATEISINQDQLFVKDEEEPSSGYEVEKSEIKYSKSDYANLQFPICQNKFCSLGCVCDSLKYKYTKEHCGLPGCMFQCTCIIEKNRNSNVGYEDKINTKNDCFQKQEIYQQTEEINFKKSRRRKRETPKTLNNFCTELNSQRNSTVKEISIKVIRLNCDNIETWCMVHNLYNCFCKGTIVECMVDEESTKSVLNDSENYNLFSSNSLFVSDQLDRPIVHYKDNIPNVNISVSKVKNKNKCVNEANLTQTLDEKLVDNQEDDNYSKTSVNPTHKMNLEKTSLTALEEKNCLKRSFRSLRYGNKSKVENDNTNVDKKLPHCDNSMKSARTRPFKRRYEDEYYFEKNKKIMDMEMNDVSLQKKLHSYFIRSLTSDCIDSERNPEENNCNLLKISETPSELGNLTDQPHKLIKNKAALISWLEAHYKRHKEKLESGAKIILEPPKLGKLALYPWEVLLERYREKKNFFLISRKPQHRIFIAVDCNNKFFKDCINIDEIRYSDLNKYPDTVKNLLTNTVNVKDTFYLLFGLAFCWELYGNVVKSKDTGKIQSFETNSQNENLLAQAHGEEKIVIRRNLNVSSEDEKDDNDICLILPNNNDSGTMDDTPEKHFHNNKSKETDVLTPDNTEVKPFSRWFFMTIEDDFDELQFVEKGFFVKYENIIKAIEVARSMKKTVRLSGLKCKGENNNPQFGIYALSDMEKLCVFVGPYDENEKLGMETIKGHRTYTSTKKTRGSWLITKKIDNFKVIENPMSFWPRTTSNANQNESTYSESNSKGEIKKVQAVEQNVKETLNVNDVDEKTIDKEHNKTPTSPAKIYSEKPLKVVKPITIRKIDEIFQIKNAPVSLLKNSNSVPPKIIINKNALTTKIILNKNQIMKPFFTAISKNNNSNRSLLLPKVNNERGMLILKPEEINKKHADNKLAYCNEQPPTDYSKNNETSNLESFLVDNEALKKADSYSDDVLVISDDDDNDTCVNFGPEKLKDIWIEISTIPKFGYFRGKKNEKNEISFQFPGFKFSEFYNENEAFQMINKILARKVYLPKSLHLDWCVLESAKKLKSKKILKEEDLSPNLIMTKSGLVTKAEMRPKVRELFRHNFAELRAAVFYATDKEIETVYELTNEAEIIINKLEATSKKLEKERQSLQEAVSTKKKKIIEISSFLPQEMKKLVRDNLDLMDF